LTKNFARRFVNGWIVIIRMSHRYVEDNNNAARREIFLPRNSALDRKFMMRKSILTILGSALLAASAIQIAAAAEHYEGQKVYREPAPTSGQFRNTNAYWPAPSAGRDWSRYQNGAESAPAGR
jgi:hypothetical protein